MTTEHRRPSCSEEETLTISPHECSVKGGERILLTFPNSVPRDDPVFLVFSGSRQRHEITTGRHSPTSLYATIPAHSSAEVVDLSVCVLDDNGEQRTLYMTQFAYVTDQKQYMAQLLLGSVSEAGSDFSYPIFPPLPSTEALREYDQSLTDALMDSDLPSGWTLVGYNNHNTINSIQDCTNRETLLHFAARHSLNSLAQYLLSLPGAGMAAILPNEQGHLPIDIAREQGNNGLAELLTLFMKEVRPNGVIEESPSSSPVTSPNCKTECEMIVGGEQEDSPNCRHDLMRSFKDVEELSKFKEINDQWKLEVKRHKAFSFNSTTNFTAYQNHPATSSSCLPVTSIPVINTPNENTVATPVDKLEPTLNTTSLHPPSPTPAGGSTTKTLHSVGRQPNFRKALSKRKRRSSVAVMSSMLTVPPPVIPLESVDFNVTDPSLADMNRKRRTSWSFIVGSCDSRSIDTGLNELDRITAEDRLCKRLVEMREGMVDLEKQELHDQNHLNNHQNQLNLLYRLSISCPMLNEADDEDTPSSLGTSPGGTVSPFYEEEDAETVPPPPEFSDRSVSRSDTCSSVDSQRHLRPTPVIPEVITTEYSDQTSSAEDLLSADDTLEQTTECERPLRRHAQSDSQLLEKERDKQDVSQSSQQQNHSSKEYRSMSPSLELLDKDDMTTKKETKVQNSDANLIETETAGMSSSAPDLLSMTNEELQWLQSTEGRLNQQSNSTDGLEMESIIEHRMLRQQVGSASPTSDDRTETVLDTSNTSVEDDDFVVVSSALPSDGKNDAVQHQNRDSKEDSVSSSPLSPSSRKSGSTSSNSGTSTTSGDRSAKTPTPSGSQRLKSHRRSLSTSEVDVLKDVRKIPEVAQGSADVVFPESPDGWKPMADISEAKSSQSLNNDVAGGLVGGGLKTGDLDERSRASSLHTNETFSPHESESSEDEVDDEFHSAQENLSKTSLDPDGSNSISTSDLLQDSSEIETLSKLNPSGSLGEVVLRRKDKKKLPAVSLPPNCYSTEQLTSEYMEEMDSDVLTPTSLAALSHRRINSTTLSSTSESDYNLRQHSNSTEEQNDEGSIDSAPAATSPNSTSQEMQRGSAATSPQQQKGWSQDSVFDQENDMLNMSDIDVKVTSDDSFAQSLESSLDQSLTSSLPWEPGSSDSIKKRTRKSPLLNRKSEKQLSSPMSRRKGKGGLTKQEVEPTIKTLRVLLSQGNIDDNLSDDDATKGSNRVTSDLKRTPSSASDSVALNTTDKEDPLKQDTLPRVPLSPAQSASETECTSLDFVPGSPLAKKRQAQLAEQTMTHPPSPLSFYHAKSPPGSSQSLSSDRKTACSSPNSIPSSPAASHKADSEPKLSRAREGKEEDDELTSLKSISEVSVSRHTTKRSQRMPRPAMSFDEGVLSGCSQPETELLGEMGEPAKEQSEEELSDPKLSSESIPPTGKDSDRGIKRVFNKDIFRRSKGSKKLSKVKKSGEAEQVTNPSVSLIQKQSINRPKSAARVQSMRVTRESEKDEEMTFMTPADYRDYKEKQHQESKPHLLSNSSGGVEVQRSISMQTKSNIGHSRSSSMQVTTPSQLLQLPRQTSDDGLITPKRSQSEGHALRAVEEELHPLTSPTHSGFQMQPSGESDNEEGLHETEQLVSTIVADPVLAIPDEVSWDKTVNRRIYKKMNKTERDRQSILHELLQTEKRYFRVLHVLKLIFRQTLAKHISEEALNSMFPELNNLIEISNNFSRKLETKCDGMVFEDCSEILLKQFSGEMYERTLEAFGTFCSGHLTAMEVYKEHMKKKRFAQIMKDLHSLKECQRLTLPDYYTHVIQHLSKILTLLKRLTNKTETLKLDHAPRLRQALQQLEMLMSGVNKTVEYHKNRKELMYIQERLEVVNIPKSDKITNRKDLKNLSLMAYDRMLRKSGEATWIGHGKTLTVHVVLVTDILVFLTERDQKYHLATLLDLKPPVIRLCDLHVRLDAAVKSGVQLLLLEKGPSPEMFRLQFVTKSEAKVWDSTLNSAIEECKKKGLHAEYFGEIGGEKLLSGDEEKRPEGESDQEEIAMSSKKESRKAVSIQESTSITSASLRAVQRAKDSIELASRVLTQLSPSSSSTVDANSAQRYHGAATSSGISRSFLRDSPKNRQRSQTGQPIRPKTTYYAEDPEPGSGTSATLSGDHVISYPIPPGSAFSGKSFKQGKEKKKAKLDRSATFKGKEKEKERERERLAAAAASNASGGGDGGESSRVPDQQVVECITKMKEALEEMVSTCEEKDEELEMANSKITKLQDEVARLREVIKCARSQEDQSPLMSRHNSHSHAHARPHSVHIDLSDRDEKLDSGESPNLAVTSTELSVRQQHIGNANNLNVKSSSRRAKNKEMATNNEEASSSQETENLNVADTGT